MHIGLFAGIGPAATDFYYRGLIGALSERGCELNLTLVHADTPTLLQNLTTDDRGAQVEIYLRLADRLRAAGAEALAITSIAGHFCIREFTPLSPIPIVNLLTSVDEWVTASGLRRIGILGTRTVMESRLYGGITAAEVIPPAGPALDLVHDAYVRLATTGVTTDALRQVFFDAGRRLVEDHGADAIMLGGTDLNAAFDGQDPGFPLIDCAGIHIDAIADLAAR